MAIVLNRRILLRQMSEVPNAAFGIDPQPDAGLHRWAKVEPVHGLAIRAGMQTGEVPTHLFFVRYGEGTRPEQVTAGHVVDWSGRRYRVLDSISWEGKDQYTRISAKDLGPI